jgi:hypothetical protein
LPTPYPAVFAKNRSWRPRLFRFKEPTMTTIPKSVLKSFRCSQRSQNRAGTRTPVCSGGSAMLSTLLIPKAAATRWAVFVCGAIQVASQRPPAGICSSSTAANLSFGRSADPGQPGVPLSRTGRRRTGHDWCDRPAPHDRQRPVDGMAELHELAQLSAVGFRRWYTSAATD